MLKFSPNGNIRYKPFLGLCEEKIVPSKSRLKTFVCRLWANLIISADLFIESFFKKSLMTLNCTKNYTGIWRILMKIISAFTLAKYH